MDTDLQAPAATSRRSLVPLAVGALGVVYGDIGTSPLYAMKEIFVGPYPLAVTPDNVFGILSLLFWSLIAVVSIKYLVMVMSVDDRGEGGIMVMMALALRAVADHPRVSGIVMGLGLFGAALFYGDGIITPAISVLSAVEGLAVAAPILSPLIVPVSLAVLIGLFVLQSRGTAHVGRLFGPIMILWFVVLAVLGTAHVLRYPEVLEAVNPLYGVHFFAVNKGYGFLVLGSVVLVVTGAEALYADMGHFGKGAIRLAWVSFVLPGLVLNYFGQGALLLQNPEAAENPFYMLAPAWGIYPLVGLATLAAIIASQAVISGAFSMTRQAIQLGYLPRMEIRHTSEHRIGQIYIPFINWALLLGVIGLVLGFGDSTNLAAAYGVAVTGTMGISTLLGFVVVRRLWGWPTGLTVAGLIVFLGIDLAFFGANSLKLLHGGWFPLAVGAVVFVFLHTWKHERAILFQRLQTDSVALKPFLHSLLEYPPARVSGTAVFLNAHPDTVPHALVHNLAHNKVLHERAVFVTVVTADLPYIAEEHRIWIESIGNNIWRAVVRYGYQETPDIPRALALCRVCGSGLNMLETSFFFSRETIVPTARAGKWRWEPELFAWMVRNAQSPMDFFKIPPNRVIELGTQVEL
jgi:KUP system potassium uptake protein